MEASLQALNQSSARNEAGNERTQAQLREFTAQAMLSHEALRKILDDKLEKTVEESRKGRAELTTAFGTLEAKLEQRLGGFEGSMSGRVDALALATTSTLDALKKDIVGQLGVMSGALKDQLDGNGNQIRNQFSTLQDAVAQQLQGMVQGSQQNSEQLRTALNERLAAIQADNTSKLEEMRRTVDEKLHATLEQRLGDSFKLVSERLEQVHTEIGRASWWVRVYLSVVGG